MLPSAISLTDGFDVATLDVAGALTSDAIAAGDLEAGRWDGAKVRLFAVDWQAPGGGALALARGEIGDVGIKDGAFTAELRGPTALLERPAVEQTSPECRADLGDKRCRVDMAGRVRVATVTAASGAALTMSAAEPSANAYGYAASGDSVRGAIETLARAVPLSIADDGSRMLLSDALPAAIPIDADALGASADDKREVRVDAERRASGTVPDEIAVTYYAPERDYQAGLQRARRGGPARRGETIELPAALPAGQAKAIAEARLATSWAERETAEIGLAWRRAELRPGGAVALPDRPGSWRIAGWSLERMVVRLKLVARSAAGAGAGAASAGRAVGGRDAPLGPTALAVMDLPSLEDAPPAAPRLWIAAAGLLPGWRQATLTASLDAGATWQPIGTTASPAVIGAAATALPDGSALLTDAASSVEIELLHEEMALEGRDDLGADAAANFALLGDELIQFGSATQLSPTRWRIARLLRGRRGTERAAAGHVAGERFVLLDADTLVAFDPPAGAIGGGVIVMASGIGDSLPATAALILAGRAVRPAAPARLGAAGAIGGDIAIGWVRRGRVGWNWLDGGDTPLGEEAERYRVTVADATGYGRTVDVIAPAFTYTAAMQAADAVSAPLTISVAQLGTGGASFPPATIQI